MGVFLSARKSSSSGRVLPQRFSCVEGIAGALRFLPAARRVSVEDGKRKAAIASGDAECEDAFCRKSTDKFG
jgi:hypothetical protein